MQACDRKINGKACAQSHTFYNHQEISKSGISPSTKTFPLPPGPFQGGSNDYP